MISLDCNHPDLEEFIEIKSDLNRITKANISIKITDEFMEAVKNDLPYTLSFTRKETGETITKEVKAKDLFRKIAKMNWDMGEPGVLFWDRIKKYNMLGNNDKFEFAGVNPCLSGDALISTVEGYIPIKDLVGQTPYVYCMDDSGDLTIKQTTKVWKTRENAQTLTIKTGKGNLVCTPDHKIYTTNRGWVDAKSLKHGDKIKGLNRAMKDETHCAVCLSGGKYIAEHRFILSHFEDINDYNVHHINGDSLDNRLSNLQKLQHSKHSVISNDNHEDWSLRNELGQFVKKDIKKKRESLKLGKEVGVNWYVKEIVWNNKKEDVYDMTVPYIHNFIANDMVVHNCAEEPLPAGGSCLLGSINLSKFVEHPFTNRACFNILEFVNAVEVSIEALDSVLDEGLPLHPLKEQSDSVSQWRQIGLGIMGLADMLIELGITYGSDSAYKICDKIGRTMINAAISKSSHIAKTKGSYPMFDLSTFNTEYIQNNLADNVVELVKNNGIRHSQLLTIAPTGTLSTMLGISGGVEPIFANYYTRKTESLHGEDKEYKVYTPIVKQYMATNNITDDKLLPEYFIVSEQIPYENRIHMQGIWQKYIDASISSTVNLPNSATVEDVENIYMKAWENGLKGITVFRSGCARMGILTTSEPTEEKEIELARGEIETIPEGVVYRKFKISSGCGSLYLFVGIDLNKRRIYDCFTNTDGVGGCVVNTQCNSRLLSAGLRGGISVDYLIKQMEKAGTCPSYQYARGKGKQLSPGKSCASAIAHILKEVQKELAKQKSDIADPLQTEYDVCPECKKQELTHEGGCIVCRACGWSRCS